MLRLGHWLELDALQLALNRPLYLARPIEPLFVAQVLRVREIADVFHALQRHSVDFGEIFQVLVVELNPNGSETRRNQLASDLSGFQADFDYFVGSLMCLKSILNID